MRLYERITSSHEHYDVLANAFFHSDVLYRCQRVVALLDRVASNHEAGDPTGAASVNSIGAILALYKSIFGPLQNFNFFGSS